MLAFPDNFKVFAKTNIPGLAVAHQPLHKTAQRLRWFVGAFQAQTPQGFHFDRILAAHCALDGTAADDVAVARAHGLTVNLVLGSKRNYKITLPSALDRALADIRASDAAPLRRTAIRAAI